MKKNVLAIFFTGVVSGILTAYLYYDKQVRWRNKSTQINVNKYFDYYQLMSRWFKIKKEGKKLEDYFRDIKADSIAIYGMGIFSDLLIDELERSKVQVRYGIDREICCTDAKIKEIYRPQDELPEIDAVVVTPFYDFDMIKEDLEKKIKGHIISLEEVIYSL